MEKGQIFFQPLIFSIHAKFPGYIHDTVSKEDMVLFGGWCIHLDMVEYVWIISRPNTSPFGDPNSQIYCSWKNSCTG